MIFLEPGETGNVFKVSLEDHVYGTANIFYIAGYVCPSRGILKFPDNIGFLICWSYTL